MDNTDWLDTWDAKIDAWESTVTAGVVAHLNRQERVVIEKLTGRKVRERYEPDGTHLEWVPLDEKAAATPAARSAAARRAWLTRRGLASVVPGSTPHTAAPSPIPAPSPHVSAPPVPAVPSAPAAARGVSATLTQAQLSARAQKAWATRRAKLGLPAVPPPAAVNALHQVAQTAPPAPAAPHVPAPAPAAPHVPSTPAPSHPFASTLAGMGAASTWNQHSTRRTKWIGNDPARREFANIAAEWIGDYGTVNNQQYLPIKDAAAALAGKARGKIANKATERKARILMDAAANGPKEPHLYRGVAYNDTELARLQVGSTFTEPLAAWSANRDISLGYGSLRTRGQRYASNPRKNIVLFELDDAHAVPISPLANSSTPAYFKGEEHLAGGQYEITSITTSKERPPWMSPAGPTPGPQTHTVTIVKVKQIARGFDPNQPGTLIKAAQADIELPGLDVPLLAGIRFTSADWEHADPAAVAEMLLGWIDEDDQPTVDETKAFFGDWVGERKIDLSAIFDPRAWIKALFADAFDWLFGITKDFGGYSVAGIAGARRFNPDDPAVRKAVETQAQRLADTVQTTASALELTLADGEAKGETIDELADRVRRVFELSREGRAPLIAATEVSNAANAAAMAAAMQTGLDLDKTWWTRRDERVRPAHKDVHGDRKSLDEPFMVGGFPMMFPGDPTAPPHLTINCRCALKPSPAIRPVKWAWIGGVR